MCGYLSEEEMEAYNKALDDLFTRNTEVRMFDVMHKNEAIQKHLNKLNDIAKLKDNWDLYGAVPIYKEVIQSARKILPKLEYQFEFEKYNGDYLELEITDVNKIEIFKKI